MNKNWKLVIYALIIHRDGETVFVTDDGQLPNTDVMAESWWHIDAGKPIVQDAFAKRLGVAPIVLRRFEPTITSEEDKTAQLVYELDYVKPRCAGRWSSAEALPNSHHRTIAQTQQAFPNKAPWMRRGWRESATQWIGQQMALLGKTIERIEPHRSWCISYLAKIYTTSADIFYFKATIALPLFVDEGAIMAYLNGLFPALVPAPVAFDMEQQWFISADFGDVSTNLDRKSRFAMLRKVAAMQIESASKVPELLANGCIDRRLPHFLQQINDRFQEPASFAGLTEVETKQLQGALPKIKRRAEMFLTSPLPATLIHGDLHQGNIHLSGQAVTIFDWSDAAVGFPWVDAMLALFAPEEERDAARDVYLTCWERYASLEELRDLWEQWIPLFYIHHAISYFSIFANLDPTTSWELGGNAAEFLRHALNHLR